MRNIGILILTFILQSCLNRDESRVNIRCNQDCITFTINVKTGLNSQTPVAGAKVELGWNRPATPIGNPGRLIAKGSTNEKGNFSFSFTPDAKELQEGRFYVFVQKDKNYHSQLNSYYGINRTDTVVSANIHLPSKALIKIIYKNFYPTTSADFFEAIPGFSSYGSNGIAVRQSETINAHNFGFYGNEPAFDKYEVTGETAGDQFTTFDILIKKNGQRIDRRDSIYIKKGETGIFEIEY
ncbi:hypothetical protein AHMF7605_24700 [Adhaeribacter arboris]|uniref:Uncharacterized protein n=1 Tax=Adhaeribacter arboris TaxID=2072846 RepID=A0A2T2YLU8_9BACT|nr:hypothetical protein [Adhaeribacter arboris]PSR56467.1 hypothetical protein AHMF7605_24700 [Adhaeribacter arboris]